LEVDEIIILKHVLQVVKKGDEEEKKGEGCDFKTDAVDRPKKPRITEVVTPYPDQCAHMSRTWPL
jgi:hypothetical protein